MRRPGVLTSTVTSMAPGGRVTGHGRGRVTSGGRVPGSVGSITELCSSVVLQRGSVVLQSGRVAVVLPATDSVGVQRNPVVLQDGQEAVVLPAKAGGQEAVVLPAKARRGSVVLQAGQEAVVIPAKAGGQEAVVVPAKAHTPQAVELHAKPVPGPVELRGGRKAVVLPAAAGVALTPRAVVLPATSVPGSVVLRGGVAPQTVALPSNSVGVQSSSVVLQGGQEAVGVPAKAGVARTPQAVASPATPVVLPGPVGSQACRATATAGAALPQAVGHALENYRAAVRRWGYRHRPGVVLPQAVELPATSVKLPDSVILRSGRAAVGYQPWPG